MDETTAGQNRCPLTKSHDRPFVIEWDATDLASFEAKAQRDVVFVRYEGCQLTVLYGCSDDSVPGKLGAYAQPTFTSGTVEGVDMKTEGDLYAQLPLAAAAFSGRLASGDTLHLRYFVSGVVTATRDRVGRASLAPYATCKDATHFVWSYNLGAFELTSGKTDSASVAAGLGGASRASSDERLKNGGELAACATEDGRLSRACRVPIRLALRPISDVDEPPPPVASGKPSGQDARAVLLEAVTRARDANRARIEARRKAELGDGEGCLADLDRLAQGRPSPPDDDELRSKCEMRAGRCAAGKTRLRQYLEREAAASGRAADVDGQIEAAAAHFCTGTQGTPKERALRAQEQIRDAERKGDAAACLAAGNALVQAIGDLGGADPFMYGYVQNAVRCAAKAGRCDDAQKLAAAQFRLANPKAPARAADAGFRMTAEGTPCAR
jgi:hypothetical protein